jgi:ketosteroid isomerase-like protein
MDRLKKQFELIKEDRIDIQDVIVRIFSEDAALAICSGLRRLEQKDGKIFNINFVYTHIWMKESNGWKIVYSGLSQETKQ